MFATKGIIWIRPLCINKKNYLSIGLGRATFFMVRVGFPACSFGTGWARVTVNLDGLISDQNISNLGHFRATFGPHLGRTWAALHMNNGNKTQKVLF